MPLELRGWRPSSISSLLSRFPGRPQDLWLGPKAPVLAEENDKAAGESCACLRSEKRGRQRGGSSEGNALRRNEQKWVVCDRATWQTRMRSFMMRQERMYLCTRCKAFARVDPPFGLGSKTSKERVLFVFHPMNSKYDKKYCPHETMQSPPWSAV